MYKYKSLLPPEEEEEERALNPPRTRFLRWPWIVFYVAMLSLSALAVVYLFIPWTVAQTQYTSTGAAAVAAARATALTLSPTSSVPGKTFDRFVNIFLENTNFDMAAGDRKIYP